MLFSQEVQQVDIFAMYPKNISKQKVVCFITFIQAVAMKLVLALVVIFTKVRLNIFEKLFDSIFVG